MYDSVAFDDVIARELFHIKAAPTKTSPATLVVTATATPAVELAEEPVTALEASGASCKTPLKAITPTTT